jgi:hypothetical protein
MLRLQSRIRLAVMGGLTGAGSCHDSELVLDVVEADVDQNAVGRTDELGDLLAVEEEFHRGDRICRPDGGLELHIAEDELGRAGLLDPDLDGCSHERCRGQQQRRQQA